MLVKSEQAIEFINNRVINVVCEQGVNRVINVTLENQPVTAEGICITTWRNHLCLSGTYGTMVFKYSSTADVLTMLTSRIITAEYLREKLQVESDCYWTDEDIAFRLTLIQEVADSVLGVQA